MTQIITLETLESALREPFALDQIKFLPKAPVNEGGKWTCLALPYADKRIYEDRLNDLVFGQWSTPPNEPFVAGNKLIIPVTVVVCGIPHTDYGEAFLSSLSRKGEVREEENSATEAYSQGFRRACAQFRLGRYLYDLPKVRVAYDPTKREIALSPEQKRELVERLYRKVGILSASQAVSPMIPTEMDTASQVSERSTQPQEVANGQATDEQMQRIRQYCQVLKKVSPDQNTLTVQAAEKLIKRLTDVYKDRCAAGAILPSPPCEELISTLDNDPLIQQPQLAWIIRHFRDDVAQQETICRRFGVHGLGQLRRSHFLALVSEMEHRPA